jgi:hypothetical protein
MALKVERVVNRGVDTEKALGRSNGRVRIDAAGIDEHQQAVESASALDTRRASSSGWRNRVSTVPVWRLAPHIFAA